MGDAAIDRDAVRENMRRVDSEAGRMERLVTQLLDAAAIENGSFALMRQPMEPAGNRRQNIFSVDRHRTAQHH